MSSSFSFSSPSIPSFTGEQEIKRKYFIFIETVCYQCKKSALSQISFEPRIRIKFTTLSSTYTHKFNDSSFGFFAFYLPLPITRNEMFYDLWFMIFHFFCSFLFFCHSNISKRKNANQFFHSHKII